MADRGQQTEQPTQRRLERARKEGRFPTSREFPAAMQFLAFVALLAGCTAAWFGGAKLMMRTLLGWAFRPGFSTSGLEALVRSISIRFLAPMLVAGALLLLVTLACQLAITKLGFSFERIAPDLARMNPVTRLGELPRQNLHLVLQALVLLPVFGYAVYAVVKQNLTGYMALPLMPLEAGLAHVGASLNGLLWKAGMILMVFGAVDLAREKFKYMREMRMTKQEVREEYKEVEGNPQTKMRIRRLQRDLSRRRMMQDVPKATAVIVNPTHFAVAIRYQMESMSAPKVVAKGRNYLAQRIRQLAVENQVPVVENPPLARSLYKSVEVGQEIPAHLFRAVAEILAYIYRLMNGRLPG
ncbi:MAG: EscU/YscU/HrcU family type III secretion system export apparatus switch protein [Acidobacteriales bacterium]|nr:EscU/YscU/HrcU family type III secretion system export apparatus switch protein [Terriglobales bacterium]